MKTIFKSLLIVSIVWGCQAGQAQQVSSLQSPAAPQKAFPASFAYNCDPMGAHQAEIGAPWRDGQQGYLPLTFEKPPKGTPDAVKPAYQQCLFYDYMWRSFIALNWPASLPGRRGQPDSSQSVFAFTGTGQNPVTVWETYKTPQQIFTTSENWFRPEVANWGNSPAGLTKYGVPRRDFLGFSDLETDYRPDVQQPYFFGKSTGPLIDQKGSYVRYEVAVNEAFFTYIRHFGYFDAAAQRDAVQKYMAGSRDARSFQRPPFGAPSEFGTNGYLRNLPAYARQGMVDVKAAWKELVTGDADNERYLQRQIAVSASETRLYGLVALHILRWAPNIEMVDGKKVVKPAYVAATFEHVDNVAINFEPPAHGKLRPSFNDGSKPEGEQIIYGFDGNIPPCPSADRNPDSVPCASGAADITQPRPVDIYRVTSLPKAVQNINDHYQAEVLASGFGFGGASSVMRFYRLIGTQNKHTDPKINLADAASFPTNGHQGPITGVYTNTNNLINAALESYTQKNFSCILCHAQAKPKCAPEKAFEDDHFKTLTFLLNGAKFREGQSCDL